MKLIVCIGDRGGMLFNKRRVSTDRVVTEKILCLCGSENLFVSPYSYPLFASTENVVCADDLVSTATNGWCFAEEQDVSGILEKADKLVVFHWNRAYPADMYFPMEQVQRDWQLEYSEEFPGHSHKKITMEVYRK